MQIQDRVIIVTGGAQGIGKGITARFLNAGWRVVIADIDADAGEECLLEYEHMEDRLFFCETDVSDEESVKHCIAETIDRFGRIDVLVNNAGIADPTRKPIEESTLSDWQRVISTNLTGCFLMARYAVVYLRRNTGSIVNIASTRARQSEPDTEAYAASKGGVLALTHALAISLGPKIRVNCISPGWIDVSGWKKSARRTEVPLSDQDHHQHPAGRVGTPDDIAAMVEYLVSDLAGFITGQNVVIDGGMTKKMIYAE